MDDVKSYTIAIRPNSEIADNKSVFVTELVKLKCSYCHRHSIGIHISSAN